MLYLKASAAAYISLPPRSSGNNGNQNQKKPDVNKSNDHSLPSSTNGMDNTYSVPQKVKGPASPHPRRPYINNPAPLIPPSRIPIIIEDSPVGGIPDKHIADGGWDQVHRKEGWYVRSISSQELISEDQTSAKVGSHFFEMILTTLYTSDSSSQQKANVA
ncbi:ABC transporter related [Striga asiatica]|uniref:ABC transporter related n=1 Tax=Striga asiatica TaxID=4170 RepID=A0A5A7RHT2_STRAF|nr:ABC transporter related [Striga asiatica]